MHEMETYNNRLELVFLRQRTFYASNCDHFLIHKYKHVLWVLIEMEYPQHMFWLRNNKMICLFITHFNLETNVQVYFILRTEQD